MLHRVGLILGLLMLAGVGQAEVIDFESLTLSNNSNFNFVPGNFAYDEKGFHLSTKMNSGLLFAGTSSSLYALAGNSTAVQSNSLLDTSVLQAIGGGAFSVSSIDVSETCLTCGPQIVTFVGNIEGGGTITQSFTMDNISGSQTVSFSGFGDITSLTWSYGYNSRAQVDNIVTGAAPVPEPATWLLLGSGFLPLMGWSRKRIS
jgi:hypothetical protein